MGAPRGQGRHGRWPYAGLHDREGPTEAPVCDAFQVSFGVCDAPYISQHKAACIRVLPVAMQSDKLLHCPVTSGRLQAHMQCAGV